MKTAHQILKDAKALIEDRKNWRKGQCRTRQPDGSEGAPYCSLGALAEAGGFYRDQNESYHKAIKPLGEVLGGQSITSYNDHHKSITSYNDHHSHKCVMAAFDAAIEKTAPK